jgi:hypothetical protein
MAKTQSFADKAKGKAKSDTVMVKCITSVYDEERKSWKFRRRMVRVKDLKEVESMTN